MPRYHAIVVCGGLTDDEANNAPTDIIEEFDARPSHQNVKCRWDGQHLWLEADNDYDADGQALLDEFGDAVMACIDARGTIHFEIVSVELTEAKT